MIGWSLTLQRINRKILFFEEKCPDQVQRCHTVKLTFIHFVKISHCLFVASAKAGF